MSAPEWSALGAALFLERCSQCHDHGGAPSRMALARNSPDQVIEAIHSGIMAPIAMFMTDRQMLAVADFVSGGQLAPD